MEQKLRIPALAGFPGLRGNPVTLGGFCGERALEAFRLAFGTEAEGLFFAPGRVNLIGEHIDYNGGHVLPCAIPFGTYAAASRRTDGRIGLSSLNFPNDGVLILEPDAGIINSDGLEGAAAREEGKIKKNARADSWTSYVTGVLSVLAEQGLDIGGGLDVLFFGDLPLQAGLSSSASIEAVTAETVQGLLGVPLTPLRKAMCAREAEQRFSGVNCGIMDQFASVYGKEDKAVFLSTSTMEYSYVPVPSDGVRIVIANSNRPRELRNGAYNDRRNECMEALSDINTVRFVPSLCSLTPGDFEELKGTVRSERCMKRARHAVTEEARTVKAVRCLREGDLKGFGECMDRSHLSLRNDFEVSCYETDVLAEEAWALPGVYGSRMTGAGFGGCTVSLVEEQAVPEFEEKVGENYKKRTGLTADFYVVTAGAGARRIG